MNKIRAHRRVIFNLHNSLLQNYMYSHQMIITQMHSSFDAPEHKQTESRMAIVNPFRKYSRDRQFNKIKWNIMCVVSSDKQKTNAKQKQNAHIQCDIIECVRAATLRRYICPIVQPDYHHLHKNKNEIYSFLSSDFIVACAVLRAQLCVHVFIIARWFSTIHFGNVKWSFGCRIEKSSQCLCVCITYWKIASIASTKSRSAYIFRNAMNSDERWQLTRFKLRREFGFFYVEFSSSIIQFINKIELMKLKNCSKISWNSFDLRPSTIAQLPFIKQPKRMTKFSIKIFFFFVVWNEIMQQKLGPGSWVVCVCVCVLREAEDMPIKWRALYVQFFVSISAPTFGWIMNILYETLCDEKPILCQSRR